MPIFRQYYDPNGAGLFEDSVIEHQDFLHDRSEIHPAKLQVIGVGQIAIPGLDALESQKTGVGKPTILAFRAVILAVFEAGNSRDFLGQLSELVETCFDLLGRNPLAESQQEQVPDGLVWVI